MWGYGEEHLWLSEAPRHLSKLLVNFCSGDFLLNEKFGNSTLTKRNTDVGRDVGYAGDHDGSY